MGLSDAAGGVYGFLKGDEELKGFPGMLKEAGEQAGATSAWAHERLFN